MCERLDVYYWQHEFRALDEKLDNCKYDVVPLESLIVEKQGVKDGPGGWLINKSEYVDNGIPMLRAVNVMEAKIDLSNVVYITEEKHYQLYASEVLPGDLLITMRGTFGRAAVVPSSIKKANMNAALCRIRLEDSSLSEYLLWYLNSAIAYKQFKRHGTKAVQDDLNLGYIKALKVIMPDEPTRCCILNRLIQARNRTTAMIEQANNLLESTKKQIFSTIDISFPDYHPNLYGYARLGDIKNYGIFCNARSAYLNSVLTQMRNSVYFKGNLEDYVDVNPSTSKTELETSSIVSFVPMTAVTELMNHAEYELKPYDEVKNGFTIFKRGDLLWAKITPCMQNGKSFIASDMPTKIGFGSTEFHVLRVKKDKEKEIYLPFLWILLSDSHILDAAQGMFSGSAGQQRVSDAFLKKLPIVLPSFEEQKRLADAVFDSLKANRQAVQEAEQAWLLAKEDFEKALLGE